MTYTFKLARRMAMAHGTIMIVLLAALAACNQGGDLKEGFAPPDLAATLNTVHTLPDSAALSPGATLQFFAFGRTLAGDSVDVVVRSWTASGGTISSGGVFQADSIPGLYQVSASAELLNGDPGRRSGRSMVRVLGTGSGGPQLAGIDIAPRSVILGAGQAQGYTAVGRLSDGSNTTVTVLWTATGGSIDNGGRYVAGTTAGSFQVIATETSGLVDTANVVISASPPPPTSGHPNEPPGFTRFYENAYDVAPAVGIGNSNGSEIDGCWWSNSSNYGVASDPTAPSGDGLVLDIRFPVGHPSGVGPGVLQEWDTCAESTNTEYSKLYLDFTLKMAGGANGDLSDWEQHPVLVKFTGFWGSGRNGQGANASDMYGFFWTNGASQFASDWGFSWINSHFPAGGRSLEQNRNGSKRLVAGQWHRMEIVLEMNSSPGSADGILKWWVDGVLVLDYSNVAFNSVASPSGFYGRHNSPTWGGLSVAPKAREDHIYYDNMYMSATP